jgi:hypothetical protein
MSTVPALPRPSKPHNRRSLCYNLRFLMITLNVHAPGGGVAAVSAFPVRLPTTMI